MEVKARATGLGWGGDPGLLIPWVCLESRESVVSRTQGCLGGMGQWGGGCSHGGYGDPWPWETWREPPHTWTKPEQGHFSEVLGEQAAALMTKAGFIFVTGEDCPHPS